MIREFKSVSYISSLINVLTLISMFLIIGISYNLFHNHNSADAVPYWMQDNQDFSSSMVDD